MSLRNFIARLVGIFKKPVMQEADVTSEWFPYLCSHCNLPFKTKDGRDGICDECWNEDSESANKTANA